MSALLAAIIFVFTAYILHIPFLTGYIHFGDTFIYLAAALLPAPYAIGASIIGAGLSDLLTFPIWTVPTVLLKAMVVLCFSAKPERIVCKRNLIGLGGAFLVNVIGYYIATGLLFQDWLIPAVRLGTDVAPPIVSSVLFVVLGRVLDQLHIKEFIRR